MSAPAFTPPFPRLAACALLALLAARPAHAASADAAPGSGSAIAAKPAASSGTAKSAASAAPAKFKPTVETKTIDRADFSLEYPVTWTEDSQAKDYNANTNFTLYSPKNSSVQFVIMGKGDEPKKILSEAMKKFDNVQITTLSRTSFSTWGSSMYKGIGQHLKGKIMDSFPGGIELFCFSTPKHNVLVIETYFSDDLKDVEFELDTISRNFKMKDGG